MYTYIWHKLCVWVRDLQVPLWTLATCKQHTKEKRFHLSTNTMSGSSISVRCIATSSSSFGSKRRRQGQRKSTGCLCGFLRGTTTTTPLIRRRRDVDEEGIALYFQRTPPETIHDNNNNNNNKEEEEEEKKKKKYQ